MMPLRTPIHRAGLVIGILLLSVSVPIVRAGTVIDQDTIDVWGKKSGLILSYSNKRLRLDQKDEKLSTIIHFRNDRILILDHTSRTYIVYPLSKWEKQVSQKIGEKEAVPKREIRVESTGAEKEINGFETKQIQVFIDGELFQDIWATQDVNLGDMLKEIKKGFGHLSGFSKAEMEEKEEIYRKVKKWGFPVLTTEYRRVLGKTLKEITEVNRIETRKLSSDLFTPPRDYKQRTQ
ncbi:MAG: DUF4412 domain-containing protein [Proteobacteria bacterium]|nr:DUF4412 domain-containing protein [Pseudomonadota bacterium]